MKLAFLACFILAGCTAAWGQEPKPVRVLKGHRNTVCVVLFSPDSKLLASVQDGGNPRLWDVSTGKTLSVLSKPGSFGESIYAALAFSPDGKLLAGSNLLCRVVTLWDTEKRTKIGTVRAECRFQMNWPTVAFHPDGKTLVWRTCDSDDVDSDKNRITFTDVATLKNKGAVKVNIGHYNDMAFSPDCQLFAVGNHDESGNRDAIALYETNSGKKLRTLEGKSSNASHMTFSPDGTMLAAAIDNTVRLWEMPSGKHISTFTISRPSVTFPGVKGTFSQYIRGVAFSPDGKTIAFGNSSIPVVELWDVATGKKRLALRGNPPSLGHGIVCIAFSPNGRMLAAGRSAGGGAWDETIELWEIEVKDNSRQCPSM